MVKFTREYYQLIGEMLRDLDSIQKLKWFDKWDQIFLNDNPRYQHEKFKAFVFETVENLMDERKRQLR